MGVMIRRDPSAASAQHHDIIVIGGGIYGVCIAMEATKYGLRPLLLERDDFGGATSWNSLRIIHGGLRYLQRLDLRRHRESVRERIFFLRTFPDLIQPLPCLMPLYGEGLKRPAVLRAALQLNDLLSADRNDGLASDRQLAGGRTMSALAARLLAPNIRRAGLFGAALWHDAVMICPQRIVMEILRAVHASPHGAMALNYCEAESILSESQRRRRCVAGVRAVDRLTGETHELRSRIVINAAGPWCCDLLRGMCGNGSTPSQFRKLFQPSLAYNLLIGRAPERMPRGLAIAVSSGQPGSRTYFLHSACRGGVLVGTEHLPMHESRCSSVPTAAQIARTVSELNTALPGWDITERDVLRVYSGQLPARYRGTEQLATRPVIVDHAKDGGEYQLDGLFSVAGVKFTTARLVAERLLGRVVRSRIRRMRGAAPWNCKLSRTDIAIDLIAPDELLRAPDEKARAALRRLLETESALTTDDVLLRRTGWLDDPRQEQAVRQRVAQLLKCEPSGGSGDAPAAMDQAFQRMERNRRMGILI